MGLLAVHAGCSRHCGTCCVVHRLALTCTCFCVFCILQVVSAGPAPLSAGTPMSAMAAATAGGSTAGSSALLSPAGSDPNSSSSTAPAAMGGMGLGSAGPSPAASPLCDPQTQGGHYHQQQQQQQSDITRVTDRLSSLSLPNMSAPSPQHGLSSIGSEHSNDLAVAAAAAAAAQHYSDLKAASGSNISNTGKVLCWLKFCYLSVRHIAVQPKLSRFCSLEGIHCWYWTPCCAVTGVIAQSSGHCCCHVVMPCRQYVMLTVLPLLSCVCCAAAVARELMFNMG